MRLLRFFLFLVRDFLPLSNKGLSDLERQTVPRSRLKKFLLGKKEKNNLWNWLHNHKPSLTQLGPAWPSLALLGPAWLSLAQLCFAFVLLYFLSGVLSPNLASFSPKPFGHVYLGSYFFVSCCWDSGWLLDNNPCLWKKFWSPARYFGMWWHYITTEQLPICDSHSDDAMRSIL